MYRFSPKRFIVQKMSKRIKHSRSLQGDTIPSSTHFDRRVLYLQPQNFTPKMYIKEQIK